MSFLAGFAFVLILTLTTIVVLFLADYLPGDFALVPVVFMFGLDLVFKMVVFRAITEKHFW